MPYRYVFKVKVVPGEEAAFEESWHNGSVPIQMCPGARGTRLHKILGEEGAYLAVAEWEDKAARQAAFVELAKPGGLGDEMRSWGKNSDFGEVTLIAEAEEIDYVLPPESSKTK
jgi:hypothetical protein